MRRAAGPERVPVYVRAPEFESRSAEQQKRRNHQREQEMLDDMRAEEVSIGEGIDGRNQIEQQQNNAGKKIRRAIQSALRTIAR